MVVFNNRTLSEPQRAVEEWMYLEEEEVGNNKKKKNKLCGG